jgi:hypothetical protein
MYIARVVIENIRGFRNLDFRLAHSAEQFAGWTVFTGDNGSGKTALLKAIALAVNGLTFARALQPSFRGWVRSGEKSGTISVEIVQAEEDLFREIGRTSQRFWAELEIENQDGDAEPLLKHSRKRGGQKKGPTRGPWAENPQGWFSCGYGPFRRLYGESPDAQRVMSGPGPVARFATMFREAASLGECEKWLKELHFRQLEKDEKSTEILKAVIGLLNDEFLQNGMRVEKIDSNGLWLKDASGVVLPLEDMSDGYRSALALLVDIVRHMAAVYGGAGLSVGDESGNLVVAKSGIVLIDEIDGHLHPLWQREIGFWLKKRFPRVQFITTSHSPFICQAADENGLFYLPAPGSMQSPYAVLDEDYRKIVLSKPTEILLSPAFNMPHTRSPRTVRKETRYSMLIARRMAGKLAPNESSELHALEQELEPLFADIPCNSTTDDEKDSQTIAD